MSVCPWQDVLSAAVSTSPAHTAPHAGSNQGQGAGRGDSPFQHHPGARPGTDTGEGLSPLPSTTSFPSEDNSAATPRRADRGSPWPQQPSSAQHEGLASQTREAVVRRPFAKVS